MQEGGGVILRFKPQFMFRKPSLLIVLAICFIACRKDRRPQQQPPVTKLSGTWQGKYGISAVNTPGDTVLDDVILPYTFIFKEDGKLTVYDGVEGATLMAEGVYSLKDGKLLAEYTYVRGSTSSFSIQATLHKPDSLAGVWRIGYWGRTGGKFYVKK
jgi:hypothetical protein